MVCLQVGENLNTSLACDGHHPRALRCEVLGALPAKLAGMRRRPPPPPPAAGAGAAGRLGRAAVGGASSSSLITMESPAAPAAGATARSSMCEAPPALLEALVQPHVASTACSNMGSCRLECCLRAGRHSCWLHATKHHTMHMVGPADAHIHKHTHGMGYGTHNLSHPYPPVCWLGCPGPPPPPAAATSCACDPRRPPAPAVAAATVRPLAWPRPRAVGCTWSSSDSMGSDRSSEGSEMPSTWCCCADTAAAAAAAAAARPRGWRPALVEATPGLGPADRSDRSSPPAAAAVVMWLAVVRWLRAGCRRVPPVAGGECRAATPGPLC